MATMLLNEDIIFLIFKDIKQSAPQYLRGLRLVSKKFNSIVTPLVYSTTRITPIILTVLTSKTETDHTAIQVRRDLTRFTRHLVINQDLEESALVGVLASLEKLHSIKWPHWNIGHIVRREAAVVAAVTIQGTSLRTLHVWGLSDGSLRSLAETCVELEELTIQAYALPNLGSPQNEDNPLSMFGKLQNLTIFTKFPELSPFVAGEFTTLEDARDANVQNWIETLVSTKQGLPFEKIVIRGKTRESDPMEEWPLVGLEPYLDALYATLPLTYTYKRTASETEGEEHIVLQKESY